MTKAGEQPTITQSDRDAADALFSTMDYPRAAPEHVIQAFARHRTTSLAAQDGLVEAVVDALLSAFLAGRGSITARERNAHKPEPSMEHFRNIALSAIKGDKS